MHCTNLKQNSAKKKDQQQLSETNQKKRVDNICTLKTFAFLSMYDYNTFSITNEY